jgi:hypothetical protein
MAGYIGTKAVLLSTTAATVTGNADIGGDLTVGANIDVSSGTIKMDGNYPVGTGNVALGDAALDSNVSGGSNTAIGADALTTNTASNNTAVGYQAGYSNTTGTANATVGKDSLRANTTGSNMAVLGDSAAYNNTSGTNAVAIGAGSLYANTTGNYNVAVGREALNQNTTASNNTAVGYQTAYSNTTGADNVAVGRHALYSSTTASFNTAVGHQAGYSNTAQYNTFLGRVSGYSNTTAVQNTFIGEQSGYYITTGAKNTVIGRFNGNQGGLDIRTSNNYIVLSDGDGNPGFAIDGSGLAFINSTNTSSGGFVYRLYVNDTRTGATSSVLGLRHGSTSSRPQIIFMNPNGAVGSVYTSASSTSFNTTSDYRLKENVVELTGATDRLKEIPVHRFNFIANPDATVDGFLAHEVQAVVPEAITGEKDAVDEDGNPVYQGIDQSKLVPLLTAALKEQQATIEALEARIAALEAN